MKILLLLLSIFLALGSDLKGQEYERTWGTYLGPAGSDLGQNSAYNELKYDTNNLYFNQQVYTNNSFTQGYYNQFVTTGSYDISKPHNMHIGSLTNSGGLVSARYDDELNYTLDNFYFDPQGNRYSLQFSNNGIVGSGTAGTWFPTSVPNETDAILFSKYTINGTLLWKTFLPTNKENVLMCQDNAGNTYISSNTNFQNGFTTSGVFQENFEVLYGSNGTILPNTYIAKLNPNGELVWASYYPSSIFKIKFYDGNLYLLSGSERNPNSSVLATTGAFQTQKANFSITKMNANTGSRIWGTYYGTPPSSTLQLSLTIEVNVSGVYVMGDVYDYTGNDSSYFGTPGSHQPIASGNFDIYLSKFSHSGSRIWSTYFGSPGAEISSFVYSPLALVGDDIIITLTQYSTNGSTNLATPGAYISTMPTTTYPNGSVNLLFAKFNSNGVQQWSSYYGGASINNTNNPSINVKAVDQNTFYLYGSTLANTGIATPGALQTSSITNERTGFIARFDKKEPEMSTSESDLTKNLVLFDNPNNGNFSLQGTVLTKKNCTMRLYDAAGRLIDTKKLTKQPKQNFAMQNKLQKGTYVIEVSEEKTSLKIFKMIVK